jgi:hypothetical protein
LWKTNSWGAEVPGVQHSGRTPNSLYIS